MLTLQRGIPSRTPGSVAANVLGGHNVQTANEPKVDAHPDREIRRQSQAGGSGRLRHYTEPGTDTHVRPLAMLSPVTHSAKARLRSCNLTCALMPPLRRECGFGICEHGRDMREDITTASLAQTTTSIK